MKKMMLYASTNKVGSECSTDLDITEEEFDAMTQEDQNDLIKEFLGDVLEYWVEAEDDEN